jgi:hypothetical protein
MMVENVIVIAFSNPPGCLIGWLVGWVVGCQDNCWTKISSHLTRRTKR